MSLLDTASLVVTPNGTKASKLYSVVPSDGSGDLSVTRATTATRVNSSGLIQSVASNVPRLDYTNGSCPSILVEPQRTNLLTYSEDLTQWNQGNEIASTQLVLNTLTGVNNATKITKGTSGSDPYLGQIQNASNGTYTNSIYLWTDSGQPTDVTLFMYNSSVSEVYTLAVTLTTTPTRYVFTSTFANTGGTITVRIDLSPSATNQYIYAYGAQLEAGSYATSYIPTTSASITRNADVISKTGISSLIGQTEGVIYLDFYYNGEAKDFVPVELYDGSSRIDFYIGNKLLYFELTTGPFLSYTTTLVKGRYKICGSYKLNDFTLYVNGVQVDTESTGTIPTCSSLNINDISFSLGTYKQQIEVNTLALWKTRLTNTQLAQLTTI